MTLPASPPIVGIPSCIRFVRYASFHCVNERYVDVMTWVGTLPLLIPAAGPSIDLHEVLRRLDGLLLTGSPSNVEPHLYEGGESETPDLHDPKRDATTLPLIRTAIAEGVPVLAICRGIQELNVALGGSLTQRVQTLPGRFDHRSIRSPDMDRNYGPAHAIRLEAGGLLHGLLGVEEFVVNSLHQQAIDRVAAPLRVEATAPDGTIEAVSMPSAPGFVLGVQWHPEYKPQENPYSVHIFQAFADAVHARARRRVPISARAA
ncbi:gamma-glutamyl-gamma-aminobutyrate hydrolase family protein [Stella sp.]|uniref:gamma-glutamyl-gamma-aminobutyrate hydrolase family protein n=1 Tax=Stella sp. TaxID=2912054 RepID=UPI0035B00449